MMKFRLAAPLGRYGDINPYDVHYLKTALNQLGYYTPDRMTGIEEDREPALFDAINKFQQDHDLPPADWLQPFSPTVYAIDRELKKQNPVERYIWRTVGDERVRDGHAGREGQVFLWNNPPEGGHPGEDYNCRCWAELVDYKVPKKNNCEEEEIEYINANAAFIIAEQNLNLEKEKLIHAQNKLDEKEEQLSLLETELSQEKQESENARIIGGISGAIIGGGAAGISGFLVGGAPVAAGAGMAAAGAGLSAGSNVGKIIEGIGDKIQKHRDNFTLKAEIAKLKKETIDLHEAIKTIYDNIQNHLLPVFKKAQDEMQKSKNIFAECRIKNGI